MLKSSNEEEKGKNSSNDRAVKGMKKEGAALKLQVGGKKNIIIENATFF